MTMGIALKNTASTDAEAALGAGVNVQAGDIGVEGDEDVIGLALSGLNFGDVSLAFGYQMQDVEGGDATALIINAGIGNAYVHLEQASVDGDNTGEGDPLGITLGYTQSLGRNTTMYYEYWTVDGDDLFADETHVMAVMKYDIL